MLFYEEEYIHDNILRFSCRHRTLKDIITQGAKQSENNVQRAIGYSIKLAPNHPR